MLKAAFSQPATDEENAALSTNLYALTEARPDHPNFGKPFYIGIGTAKRPYKHLAQSRAKAGHRNPHLHQILAAHSALDLIPEVHVLAVYETKDEAGTAEKDWIVHYGRIGIEPNGTLCNLACGGQGPDAELMRLPEVRERNAKAQRNVSPETKAARIAALVASRTNPKIEARRRENSKAPQKASWANPIIRAKRASAMKGKKKTASPEALEARRQNAKKSNTPEANAAKAEASRQRWADPEFRARMAEKRKASWQDPKKRANMLAGRSEGIAKSWRDTETRRKRIDGIRAKSESIPKAKGPGRSATMSALNATKTAKTRSTEQRTAWDNPDVRAKRLEGIRRAAQSPGLTAKRLAAMLEGKQRRAAEKAAAVETADSESATHLDEPCPF